MLGARTKQVNSYGRRTQRIISASDERQPRKEIPNIFDEPKAPIHWAPIVSKMRKREDVAKFWTSSTSASSSSPRLIHVQRRKPLISPAQKKPTTGAQEPSPPQHERWERHSTPQKDKEKKAARCSGDAEKRCRPPLASHSINIPSSPAIAKPQSRHAAPKVPKKLHKPMSDVVDVEIILLDERGMTISKERRASHTKVRSNSSESNKAQKPPCESLPDSEDEVAVQSRLKGLKRQVTARRIVSDGSDSEDGSVKLADHPAKVPDSSIISDIDLVQHQHTRPSQYHIPSSGRNIHPSSYPKPPKSATSSTLAYQSTRSQASSLQSNGRYTHIPSPIIRPRQLTPIRGSRNTIPKSPLTPTDFDSSIDLSDIDLSSSVFTDGSQCKCDPTIPGYLKPLLQECHQEECGLYEFSSFIKSFPYDPIIRSSLADDDVDINFKKIGEASYSEVFGIGDVVLKIIPLRNETLRQNGAKTNGHEIESPATSDAGDVRKEIIVTRAMGEVCDGFVKLLKAYVVRGRYPDLLLQLWDGYNETRGSESVRPDTFTVSQTYAIIVLPNGGPDLEAYTFTNTKKSGWRQACSIFWQISKALARAEQLVSFEHRDLHWGQILVKDLSIDSLSKLMNLSVTAQTSDVVFMDDPVHGVQTTIIDLGLSRMDASDSNGLEKIYWTPIEEEVFMGEGDYQFDIYRLMKEHSVADWARFNPLTNVMWLHYLVLKLLQSKRLRPPAARTGHTVTTFTEKECYKCLLEMEELLAKRISDISDVRRSKSKGQGRRKPDVPARLPHTTSGFSCAGDVVCHGVEKGWIMPLT